MSEPKMVRIEVDIPPNEGFGRKCWVKFYGDWEGANV